MVKPIVSIPPNLAYTRLERVCPSLRQRRAAPEWCTQPSNGIDRPRSNRLNPPPSGR